VSAFTASEEGALNLQARGPAVERISSEAPPSEPPDVVRRLGRAL
jgi:hypothetical protein